MGRFTSRAFRTVCFPAFLLMLILTAGILMLPGCSGVADLALARESAARGRTDLSATIAAAESVLATLSETDPGRDDLARDIQTSRAAREAVDAAIRQIDLAVAEAISPTDSLTMGLRAIGESVPEPARAPLLLGGALLVTVVRAARLKAALISVARSIEKAKAVDESFHERFRAHAPTFRSVQTPTAKKIIDEATKNTFVLRFPV